jgi:ElaB/YqjD/DUF883 family membrane-anchored ribosome-binding protein
MATAQRSTTDYEAALDEIAERGAAAFKNTRARVESVVSDAADKGEEALQSAREVRDTVADAILRSVRERPYTTLAIAGFLGFLYGAMRRR